MPQRYRQMTPEEQQMLWSQGQQGMQPQVAPMSLLDLAMEGVGSFLDEADVAKYLLPASLLGMVRYKRPGVSAAARETAEAYHQKPVNDRIQARDTVFHATNPQALESILKEGEIVPSAYADTDRGVSVSRVPRVMSSVTEKSGFSAHGPVSLVIDPAKAPPMRPYAEPVYGKTVPAPLRNERRKMNPYFEFESRTYGQPVPKEAIREIWLDRADIGEADALVAADLQRYGMERGRTLLDLIRSLAEQHSLPLREFETGREMLSGRVKPKK